MNLWYLIGIYFMLFLIALVATMGSIAAMIIFYKKKRQVKTPLMSFVISVLVLISVIIFVSSHSTYYRYNDWWILQNNIYNVLERYGEFDLGTFTEGESGCVGYYIYTDNGPIMPDHLKHYYYIKYDEFGVIYEVYDGCQPGG